MTVSVATVRLQYPVPAVTDESLEAVDDFLTAYTGIFGLDTVISR